MSTTAAKSPVTMTTNSIGSPFAYPYTTSTVTFVDELATTTTVNFDKTKLYKSVSWCPQTGGTPQFIINPVT
jgi:hypothetical protein